MDSNNKLTHRAFLLTSLETSQLKDNQSSWETFANLVQTCGFALEVGDDLPNENYQYYFINQSGMQADQSLPKKIESLTEDARVIMFNADEKTENEVSLVLKGFFGVLYSQDRADKIMKGIQQLMQKERWFKRKSLDEALSSMMDKADKPPSQEPQPNSFPRNCVLTKREKTIISLITSGAKNQEIADKLHISPNTVKTHIYSIFRKTKSRNRVDLINRSMHTDAVAF